MDPFNMRQEENDRLINHDGDFLFKNIIKEQDTWLQDIDQNSEKIDSKKYEKYLEEIQK